MTRSFVGLHGPPQRGVNEPEQAWAKTSGSAGCPPERPDGVRRCAGQGGQACLCLAEREGLPVRPFVGFRCGQDCRLAWYRLRRKP